MSHKNRCDPTKNFNLEQGVLKLFVPTEPFDPKKTLGGTHGNIGFRGTQVEKPRLGAQLLKIFLHLIEFLLYLDDRTKTITFK